MLHVLYDRKQNILTYGMPPELWQQFREQFHETFGIVGLPPGFSNVKYLRCKSFLAAYRLFSQDLNAWRSQRAAGKQRWRAACHAYNIAVSSEEVEAFRIWLYKEYGISPGPSVINFVDRTHPLEY